jgi:DNA-binding transcriptional ArsR family regulator
MSAAPVTLLDAPDAVRLALSPIRRRLLERLRTPASASALASELALGRQRVNYHMRALETAGLIHLVEVRRRRGCVERILAARADAFVVDPSVMGERSTATRRAAAQDAFSAEHLIDAAADVVRHVARMRARAEEAGTRLLTFAIDTEIAFAAPADLERFTTALAEFVAREASRVHQPAGGRRYRILLGGHPAPGRHLTSGVRHGRSRPRRNPRRRAH